MVKFPNIKLYRQAKGDSQGDIAEKLKMNIMTYSRKELGQREFTASDIVELAKLFGCTTDDLLVNNMELKIVSVKKVKE